MHQFDTTILCLPTSEWNNIKSLNLTSIIKNKIEPQKCVINLHILLINDKNVIVHTKCDNSKITLYLSLCSHPASFCGLNIIVILIEEKCVFFVLILKGIASVFLNFVEHPMQGIKANFPCACTFKYCCPYLM